MQMGYLLTGRGMLLEFPLKYLWDQMALRCICLLHYAVTAQAIFVSGKEFMVQKYLSRWTHRSLKICLKYL